MAAQGLKVRVSAEVSSFARDINRATQDVNRFSSHVNGMGSTLTRTGRAAATAASSLHSLGSVLPGLGTATGSLVGNLGKASIVLGEVTVLGAGLTKGWGLLAAATKTLGPVAGGVLATLGPMGAAAIATAGGVALLASEFSSLGRAISQSQSSFKGFALPSGVISNGGIIGPGIKSIESIDLAGREMDPSKMTGRRAHVLEGVTTSSSASGNTAQMALVTWQVTQATREWQQALAGMRPLTESVTQGWVAAMDAVNSSLRTAAGATKTELIALKAQLQDVFRVSLNVPNVLGPPRDFAKGAIDRILNPAYLADDLLGATGRTGVPTPGIQPLETSKLENAFTSGMDKLQKAIVSELPLRLSMLVVGRTPAGSVGGALGGSFGGAFGSGVAGAFWKEGSKGLGALLGSAVLPIIGSVGGAWLGSKMGDLFGSQSKRMVEMWDTAQRRYVKVPADQATSSLTKFARELDRVTQTTISNIPTGFKIARFVDAAADPETSLPSGTNRRGMYVFQIGTLSIRADNPDDFAEQMSMAAEKAVRRGGVSGFQLAVAQTARGY